MAVYFNCTAMLTQDGVKKSDFRIAETSCRRYEIGAAMPRLKSVSYCVSALPIDFHCHGVGKYYFANIGSLDLDGIERRLEEEGVMCFATLHLAKDQLKKVHGSWKGNR
jgi:hypothetical protein